MGEGEGEAEKGRGRERKILRRNLSKSVNPHRLDSRRLDSPQILSLMSYEAQTEET